MTELITQTIGFIALTFFIISYQIKSNRALFLCQLIGCSLFCIQLTMLGAFTGAMGLIISILRNLLLFKIQDWKWVKSRVTLLTLLVLLLLLTYLTWAGWISLMPFLSVTIITLGYWTNNAQKIRLSQFLGAPVTLIYDILIGSWGGVISETITFLSIFISIIRFGWKDMDKEENPVH